VRGAAGPGGRGEGGRGEGEEEGGGGGGGEEGHGVGKTKSNVFNGTSVLVLGQGDAVGQKTGALKGEGCSLYREGVSL